MQHAAQQTRRVRIAMCAVVLLSCAGCTTIQRRPLDHERPDWYGSRIAPADDATNCFFVGVSPHWCPTEDEARLLAKEQARAEVAAFLNTEVSRVFDFSRDYAPPAGTPAAQSEKTMRQELVTRVNARVAGARIIDSFAQCSVEVDAWGNERVLAWHAGALTAFPRKHAAAFWEYQQKLEELRLEAKAILPEAAVLFRSGRKQAAIEMLRCGIIDYPNTVVLRERLADYHAASDQYGEALRQWRAIVGLPGLSVSVADRAHGKMQALESAILSRHLSGALGGCVSRSNFAVLRWYFDHEPRQPTAARAFVERLYDVENDPFAMRLLNILAAEEYRLLSGDPRHAGGCDRAIWYVAETERQLRKLDAGSSQSDQLKALVLCKLMGIEDQTLTDGLRQIQRRADLKSAMDGALRKLYCELFSGCGAEGIDPLLW